VNPRASFAYRTGTQTAATASATVHAPSRTSDRDVGGLGLLTWDLLNQNQSTRYRGTRAAGGRRPQAGHRRQLLDNYRIHRTTNTHKQPLLSHAESESSTVSSINEVLNIYTQHINSHRNAALSAISANIRAFIPF